MNLVIISTYAGVKILHIIVDGARKRRLNEWH